jgi:hypothetical protein
MKKDNIYFSHDYSANSDFKILLMRQDLGMEGYGIYWYLIEKLAEAGGALPLKIIPILSQQALVEAVKVQGVIEKYDLFTIHEGSFFSERLLRHLQSRKALSEAGKKGASLRWSKNETLAISESNSHPNSHPITPPNSIKVKESKVKESKVKENNIFNFKNSFLALGVDEQVLDDWLQVRKLKKGSNTKTAFNGFLRQFEKTKIKNAGITLQEVVTLCAEKGWVGYEDSWFENIKKQRSTIPKDNPF